MTTYLITVPGTFHGEVTDASRAALLRGLRSSDPQQTALGEAEDLDLLTVNENGTFNIRLEIEADDSRTAEARARQLAGSALRSAGFAEDDAPLGPAVVTGIDTGT